MIEKSISHLTGCIQIRSNDTERVIVVKVMHDSPNPIHIYLQLDQYETEKLIKTLREALEDIL